MTETILWHNERRLLSDLIPYEHNPRILTKEAAKRLTKSLRSTGYAEVIVKRYKTFCLKNGKTSVIKRNGEVYDG